MVNDLRGGRNPPRRHAHLEVSCKNPRLKNSQPTFRNCSSTLFDKIPTQASMRTEVNNLDFGRSCKLRMLPSAC
jgi:hypothetical protein